MTLVGVEIRTAVPRYRVDFEFSVASRVKSVTNRMDDALVFDACELFLLHKLSALIAHEK
jgi:hypothetical protein